MTSLKARADFLALAVLLGLCHVLVLLNDGIYMDGWRDYHFQTDGNLAEFYLEAGLPQAAAMQVVLRALPGQLIGFRILSFVTALAIPLLMLAILKRTGRLGQGEALMVAGLAGLYPLYEYYPQSNAVFYQLCWALFLLATLWLMQKPACLWRRVGASALFLYSFGTASLLMVFGGVFCLLFWLQWEAPGTHTFWPSLRRFLPRHLDLFLLPFVYWGVKGRFFPNPPSYNQFVLSWRVHAQGLLTTLETATLGVAENLVDTLREGWPFFALVGLGLAYGLWRRWEIRPQLTAKRGGALGLIGAGLGLGFLAAYPYAAVGKPVTRDVETTPDALLLGLPLALVGVGLWGLLPRRAKGGGLWLVGMVAGLMAAQLVVNHVAWQAYWVKDRSLLLNLASYRPAEDETLWVYDAYPRNYLSDQTWPNWQHRARLVWWEAYGGFWRSPRRPVPESDFGLAPSPKHIVLNFALGKDWIRRNWGFGKACHTLLIVQGGPRSQDSALSLAWGYQTRRLFAPADLDAYLVPMTQIQTAPLPTPLEADCPRHPTTRPIGLTLSPEDLAAWLSALAPMYWRDFSDPSTPIGAILARGVYGLAQAELVLSVSPAPPSPAYQARQTWADPYSQRVFTLWGR